MVDGYWGTGDKGQGTREGEEWNAKGEVWEYGRMGEEEGGRGKGI